MKIIGHAGARGLSPENTIASFKKALEYQVDAIECDVRVTADNIPVLHHNPSIKDPSGAELRIDESNLHELREHKSDLSTLEAVISIIDRNIPLYLDIKPGIALEPVIKIIRQFFDRGWQPNDLILASFDQRILLALRHAFPNGELVVLERWSGVKAGARARQLNTTTLAMNKRWLWWPFIRSVSRHGYTLYAYTVNSPAKAKRWEKAGLDGIFTDFPDRFRAKLKP